METRQTSILLVEEVLLEAICFDFVVDSPHAELVELFNSLEETMLVKEYAWSIAHDSFVCHELSTPFTHDVVQISDAALYTTITENHSSCLLHPRSESCRRTELSFPR